MTEEHLFELALSASDAERAGLLDRECAGDAGLRARIEALLQADARSNLTIDSPNNRAGSFAERNEAAGVVIAGKYKLVELIGEGGMGTVWAAEQEQPVKRRVALKLIKAGMDTRQVIARFEAERQALALMDHSNIAKVFDAGTTPTGRPYFVMELVKGVPITKYCDELQLTLRERLALFMTICQAIQHAHQKGVIHRDIKPSNVLIAIQDGRPAPKIIDFGVAKALHQQLADESMHTEIGAVVGTLEYMSPEQAELSPLGVDTRADVYALGVLLYELLTGTTPLNRKQLKQAAYVEMLRIIVQDEPAKPSSRLTESKETLASVAAQRRIEPAQLTKAVSGDLDWIVMKALDKDRNRRYETANGFARDIERFLNDEPVEAARPSATYRLRKFVRRNKGPVIAAGLVAAALILGVTFSTIGFATASRNAKLAAIATDKANEDAAFAKAMLKLTRDKIVGEAKDAAEELSRILDEIVDRSTAKSKRAEFVASFRRVKRAVDTVRSLADTIRDLPARPKDPEDIAFSLATVKAASDLAQKMQKLTLLMQKYPAELMGVVSEALMGKAESKAITQMAEMLAKAKANPEKAYEAARKSAATAAEIQISARPDATKIAKEAADQAMNWLIAAVAAGYKDLDHMKKDKGLDPLREREDFKELIAELEAKAVEKEPGEKKKPLSFRSRIRKNTASDVALVCGILANAATVIDPLREREEFKKLIAELEAKVGVKNTGEQK